jgi:hypothetical protein
MGSGLPENGHHVPITTHPVLLPEPTIPNVRTKKETIQILINQPEEALHVMPLHLHGHIKEETMLMLPTDLQEGLHRETHLLHHGHIKEEMMLMLPTDLQEGLHREMHLLLQGLIKEEMMLILPTDLQEGLHREMHLLHQGHIKEGMMPIHRKGRKEGNPSTRMLRVPQADGLIPLRKGPKDVTLKKTTSQKPGKNHQNIMANLKTGQLLSKGGHQIPLKKVAPKTANVLPEKSSAMTVV